MSAVDLIGVMPKPLLDDAAEEGGPPGNSWSSRHSKNRVGTSAHAFITDGSFSRAADCVLPRFSASAASAGGTSW